MEGDGVDNECDYAQEHTVVEMSLLPTTRAVRTAAAVGALGGLFRPAIPGRDTGGVRRSSGGDEECSQSDKNCAAFVCFLIVLLLGTGIWFGIIEPSLDDDRRHGSDGGGSGTGSHFVPAWG